MAFTQSTFAPVGPQSTDAPSIYSYRTTDDNAALVVAGYFVDKKNQLEAGDLIMCSTGDSNTFSMFQVLSDTSSVTNVSDEYVDNVTQDYMPIKDGGELVDSPLRLENGVLISSVTIQTPPASVLIGSNVRVTDGGSGLGYFLEATNSTFEVAGSLYKEDQGTVVGLAVTDYPSTGAFDIPTQSSAAVTNSYEDYIWEAQIFTKAQDPINGVDEDLFRIYRVVVKGGAGPQAPVRLRIYFEDPDLNPSAMPFFDNMASREPLWESGNAGFILQDGVDTTIEFNQGQRLRTGLKFWIRYTVPTGEQFSVKGDNVDIGFGVVFVPYQVSTVMPGYEIDIAPPRERGTVTVNGTAWTTLIDHPIALDSTENVTFNAYGEQELSTDLLSGELVATVSNASGVATIVGNSVIFRHRLGASTSNIRAIAGVSGNALLQIRGTAGNDWNWKGTAQTREQSL